jgi:hypothetical protein
MRLRTKKLKVALFLAAGIFGGVLAGVATIPASAQTGYCSYCGGTQCRPTALERHCQCATAGCWLCENHPYCLI